MSRRTGGFALPTVLIVSVILLMLLVTGMSATVAVQNGLRDQHYTRLAELASDAGNAFATACFTQNGNQITWSDANPLRPNTDCSGNIDSDLSAYVLDQDNIRTYFVVDSSMQAKGYAEGVRSSTNLAWRVWTSGSASAVAVPTGANDPVGTYIEGAWTSAPNGYLLADGSAVSRTTYSALFAVIGTTYGAGNGSTTFNLPDTRGRVTVQQSADVEFNSMGELGGEKTHILSIAEMPSHTHIQNPHNHSQNPHSHGVTINRETNTETGGNSSRLTGTSSGSGQGLATATTTATNNATTATNQNAGGGSAHNNLQPYIVVTRAIKY